jgi:hypothetical protein
MHIPMIQSTESIIVYRSAGEQMADQFLWAEGGFVYIFGLMLVTVVAAIAYDKIRTTWNRWRWNRAERERIIKRKFEHADWR